MTQLNNRVSVGFTDEEWERIQNRKREHFDKSYAQVVKELILQRLDDIEQEEKARNPR